MIHFDYSTNWFIELVCVWVLSMVIRLKYILWSMYIDCNMYICDILSDPYSICQTNFDLGHTFYGFFLWKPISLSCRAFNLTNETVHSVDHKVTKGRLEKKIIQNELVQTEVRNYEVLRCDTECIILKCILRYWTCENWRTFWGNVPETVAIIWCTVRISYLIVLFLLHLNVEGVI